MWKTTDFAIAYNNKMKEKEKGKINQDLGNYRLWNTVLIIPVAFGSRRAVPRFKNAIERH